MLKHQINVRRRLGLLILPGAIALLAFGLAPLLPATPAIAQGFPAPSLSISPSSGPVGTVIRVSGTVDPSCLAGDEPLYFEGSVPGHGADYLSPLVNRKSGGFTAQIVVPSYLGGVPAGTGGTLVHPGPYEIRVVTTCGGTVAGPTLVQSFQVTSTAVVPQAFVGMAPTADGHGYWLAQADGGVRAFGNAVLYGSLTGSHITPAAPIVGIASTPDGGGYWLVGADGGVFSFGDATFYGSLPAQNVTPAGPIVGMARTPSGDGYWLLGADGGVFSFGDAAFYGTSARSAASGLTGGNTPVYAIAATPHGHGYYVTSASAPTVTDGFGSAFPKGGMSVSADTFLSGFALTLSGQGYWYAGTDGGVFSFGDASFYGSLPGEHVMPAAPIVGMARTPDGGGYWLLGADGGVFSFGDAGFYGSAA